MKTTIINQLDSMISKLQNLQEKAEDKASESENDATIERWDNIASFLGDAADQLESTKDDIEGEFP